MQKGVTKKVFAAILILAMLLGMIPGINLGVMRTYAAGGPQIGDTLSFGNFDWVFVAIPDGESVSNYKILMKERFPSNAGAAKVAFDTDGSVYFNNSSIKTYLNGTFLSGAFNDGDTSFIADTKWVSGDDTSCKIGLLTEQEYTDFSSESSIYVSTYASGDGAFWWLLDKGKFGSDTEIAIVADIPDSSSSSYLTPSIDHETSWDIDLNARPALNLVKGVKFTLESDGKFYIDRGAVNSETSTIAASPASVEANGSSTSTITVTLQDTTGTPVSGKTVSLTPTAGSSIVTEVSAQTNASGQATFTVKGLEIENVTYTAKDETDSIPITQTAAVSFVAGAVNEGTSTVTASPASIEANGTSTSTVTVSLKDAAGHPVSGKTVSLTPETGSSTVTTVSPTTNTSGQAIFTVKDSVIENVTYTAKDETDGIPVTQTATVSFTIGAVNAGASTVTASPASIEANGISTSTVTVTLKDAAGHPVSGKTVSLTPGTGSSTVTEAPAITDASGQVTFTVKNSVVESVTYTAKDETDSIPITQTAAVNFTAGAVSEATSTVTASPDNVEANGTSTSTVTVTLKDAVGHPVSGKTVSLTPGSGSSTVTEILATTNASGQATFTVKDSVIENVTYSALDVTDNINVTQTIGVSFTVGEVNEGTSTVTASPTSIEANGTSTSAVTVTLKDAVGRPVSGKAVSLTPGAGSSTVTAISAVTNASGQAIFAVKDSVIENVTYSAKDETDSIPITQTAAVSFTIGSVNAEASTVTVSPTSIEANGTSTSTVTVTLKDISGHSVSGKTVSLTPTAGSSTVTAISAITNASGQATFTVKDSVIEYVTYTAIDVTDNRAIPQIVGVSFTTGAVNAGTSTVTASPASIEANGISTSAVTVTLKDVSGHPVSGKTVSLTPVAGSSIVTTISAITNASGQATFTVKDSVIENVTYTAIDETDSIPITQTVAVNFTIGSVNAETSTVTASPDSVEADGSSTSTVTVTLKDSVGHPVSGKTVSLTPTAGSSTVTAISAITNASGQATFTVKDFVIENVTYTAIDVTDGIPVTQIVAVNFTVGAVNPGQSMVTASPDSVEANGTSTSTITVTLKDFTGHPVSGKTVSLTPGTGSSTVTAISAVTNASGQTTFTVKDSVIENITYTAIDETDSIPITQTAAVSFTIGSVNAETSTVTASPDSVEADGSSTSTVTVTLKDVSGHPVSGKTVSLTPTAGSSTVTAISAITNASGQATFTVKDSVIENVTYSALDVTDNINVTQTIGVSFTVGEVNEGTSTVTASPTSIEANGSSTSTITVTLKDVSGHPVSGKAVSLTPGAGSSTVTAISAVTNASGQATFTVKDSVIENVTYTAKDETDNITVTQTAAVSFTIGAVNAGTSTVTASPDSLEANGTSTSTVTVTLKDAAWHPVSGKTVTLTPGAGSSTVTEVSAVTNASGQATFTVKDSVIEDVTYTAKDETDSITITQTVAVSFTTGAVNAGASTVTVSPASIEANGISTSTITVTLKDAAGHPVNGKTVSLTSGTGSSTVTAISAITNFSGQATFTVKDSVIENVTYTAKDETDNITVTQTAAVSFTIGAVDAGASTVTVSPASIEANGSSTSTITVTLKDAAGHPVSGKTVTLTPGSGSSTVTDVSAITNASGQATFTVKDSVIENVTYTAKDQTDNITITQTAAVSFTTGAVNAGASTVTASPASIEANGSSTSTITVTLKDAAGHPVNGKTVSLTSGTGSSTVTAISAITNLSGQATFTVKDSVIENVTYTAKDETDNITVTQTAAVNFTIGAVNAGTSNVTASLDSVEANGTSTSTVTVTLKDAAGHPVSGKTVSLTPGSGSSTVTDVSAITNASGQATFTVKDSVIENITYTAKDQTDNITITQTAAVSFTTGAVNAGASTVTVSPASIEANGSSTSTVTVTLKDAAGHPVNGKTVSLTPTAGSSTVTQVSAITNASGQATFTVNNSEIENVTYTAKDETDNITVTQTATVNFTIGAVNAGTSTVTASPDSVEANGTSTSTVTVTLKDAAGHPVSGKTVSLTPGAGSSTVTEVANITNTSGQATFTVKDSVIENVTYTAKDETDNITVTQTIGVSFTVGAVNAGASTATVSPASIEANGTSTSTVTVTLKDVSGHPVSGKTVSLTPTAGSSTVTQVSAITNASGQATFTVKNSEIENVTYTAKDETDNITVTQTATVNFTIGAVNAGTSIVTTSPASIEANGTSTSTVTVTLKDVSGHPVSGKTVSLTPGAGSSTVTAISAITNASGQATFTVKDSVIENVTFTALDVTDNITVEQTAAVSFTIGTVNAGTSIVTTSPASIEANGTSTSTVTVTLKDVSGHPVSGKTVSLTPGAGSSTVTAISAITNASGQATFNVKDSVIENVTYTAIDVTDSITVAQTVAVNFTIGAVNGGTSTVNASPSSIVANGSTTSTVTVTLRDAGGHPISGKTVSLTGSSITSNISAVQSTTTSNGQATFKVKNTVVETVTYTAKDDTDNIEITQNALVNYTAVPSSSSSTTSSTSSTPTPTTPPKAESAVVVIVNGIEETAATSETTKADDKTVTKVTVNDQKIEEKLNSASGDVKPTVVIPVSNHSDVVVGELNGQTVKNMETKEAILEIKTDNVSYVLPAAQINIAAVSDKIGKDVELKDIKVQVTVAEPSQDTSKIVQNTADKNSYQVIVKPVAFEITCTNGEKTVEVSKFKGYVERTVSVPDGVDPSKITTGIVLNTDGTFSHVPTSIVVIDGKYYAKINSLTNSTYSVIWNPVTFKDVQNHWSKEVVEDIASRLVMDGVTKDKFMPDQKVTRAEFVDAVIRALGLKRSGAGKDVFTDVNKKHKYYDSITLAYEYGILKGDGKSKCNPDAYITRQEAMTILSRAMIVANIDINVSSVEIKKFLSGYKDNGEVSSWATTAVVVCIKDGIVEGYDKELSVKENITRAQTAAFVRRMLKKAGLI